MAVIVMENKKDPKKTRRAPRVHLGNNENTTATASSRELGTLYI